MRIILILIVISAHAFLIKNLMTNNDMMGFSDLSSEGLTELSAQTETKALPKFLHQNEERVITVEIGSDWLFPNAIVPEPDPTPEPKAEPIPEPEPIPVSKPIKVETPKAQPTQPKAAPKAAKNNQQINRKGTGQGERNAVGRGTGKNNTDGPSGFSVGNAEQLILKNVNKCYPLISRQRGEEGVATVRIHVDAKGNVTHVELIKPAAFSRLNKCAIAAVKGIKVKPKIVNGQPTSSHFDKAIRFRLK